MTAHVLVLAKAPRPGRVKTRLCPPCTPDQAAAVALAALHDTLDAVDSAAELVGRRTLVLAPADDAAGAGPNTVSSTVEDHWWPRPGWDLCGQRGTSLGQRIGHAFADTAVAGLPSVLIGMDTPQITAAMLARCVDQLSGADAVLGPAADGGWWLLGLRDPARAAVVADVPTSKPDTGARTRAALSLAGLSVAAAPVLRDVDTARDAWRVAGLCPADSRFATAVRRNVPPRLAATWTGMGDRG